MTFNILAFITIHVYLSSEKYYQIKNLSRGPLVELTQNDPAVSHYIKQRKNIEKKGLCLDTM